VLTTRVDGIKYSKTVLGYRTATVGNMYSVERFEFLSSQISHTILLSDNNNSLIEFNLLNFHGHDLAVFLGEFFLFNHTHRLSINNSE
jgi:hypothetical protein